MFIYLSLGNVIFNSDSWPSAYVIIFQKNTYIFIFFFFPLSNNLLQNKDFDFMPCTLSTTCELYVFKMLNMDG